MSGWIKLHRSLLSHPLWNDKPFSRGQAWIDLILNANHSDKEVMIKGEKFIVKRGQQARSEVTLSHAWGWDRGKVRRFLRDLKTLQQIEQQTHSKTSIITICNYCGFQDIQTAEQTADATAEQTASEQQANTNKNVKNKKNNNPPKSPQGNIEIPQWIDQGTFEEFLVERKRLKASNSETALNRLVNKLSELSGQNPVIAKQIIEESIMNGWKGVFPLKENPKPQVVSAAPQLQALN